MIKVEHYDAKPICLDRILTGLNPPGDILSSGRGAIHGIAI